MHGRHFNHRRRCRGHRHTDAEPGAQLDAGVLEVHCHLLLDDVDAHAGERQAEDHVKDGAGWWW